MKKTVKAVLVAASTSLSTLALMPILSVVLSAPAMAQTASTNFNVNANVANNCTITAADLNFGTYDPTVANATAAKTAQSSVTITCTKGATATVGIDKGTGSTARRMVSGTNNLNYELFKPDIATPTACPASPTAVWGTSGTELLAPGAAPSRAARTYAVCGQIAPAQDVAAGNYADTVTATVNF